MQTFRESCHVQSLVIITHQGVIKRKCITKILSFELQVSITHPITHSLPLHTLGVLHTPFLHYTLCNTPLVGVYLIIHVNVCNTCVLQPA